MLYPHFIILDTYTNVVAVTPGLPIPKLIGDASEKSIEYKSKVLNHLICLYISRDEE